MKIRAVPEKVLEEVCPNWTEYGCVGPSQFWLVRKDDGSFQARAAVSYTYVIDLDDADLEEFREKGVEIP